MSSCRRRLRALPLLALLICLFAPSAAHASLAGDTTFTPAAPSCTDPALESVRPGKGIALWLPPACGWLMDATWTITAQPEHGTVIVGPSGDATYTAPAGYTGADAFTFQVTTADGTATATQHIDVTPQANHAPTCWPGEIAVHSGRTRTIGLNCHDDDGDPLSYTVGKTAKGALGSVTPSPYPGGPSLVTYTPAAEYVGDDSFTVIATDDRDTSSDEATQTIHVRDAAVNVAPDCSRMGSLSIPVMGGSTYFSPGGCTDDEGDPLTFAVATQPTHGTVTVEAMPGPPGAPAGAQAFHYTPEKGYTGPDSFTWAASDGTATSDPVTLSLTVQAAPAPTCSPPAAVGVRTDRSRSIALRCPYSPDATYEITAQPTNGTLDLDGSFPEAQYTPKLGFNGTDSFSYRMVSPAGTTEAVTQTITVDPEANTAPECFSGMTNSVRAGQPRTLTIYCTDVDGDPVTVTQGDAPSHGTLTDFTTSDFGDGGATTTVTYTSSDPTYLGGDTFTVVAKDGRATRTALVGLTVRPADFNTAPFCFGGEFTVASDDMLWLTDDLGCLDSEDDPVTLEIVSPPAHGTLSPVGADGVRTYTPNAGYTGTDTITYRGTDSFGGKSQPATLNITVTAPNGPDTTAPDTSIVSGPDGLTRVRSATIRFNADELGAHFECKLDAGDWSSCTSPFESANLADGDHAVQVRAIDAAGNADDTPATQSWTVDATAPHARLTSAPVAGSTTGTSAWVAYASDEAGSTFECKLDAGTWEPCPSGRMLTGLAAGSHTLATRAIDTAGNVSDAVSRTWNVVADAGAPAPATQGTADKGGTVSTGDLAAAPTTAQPVIAAITTPQGGDVTVTPATPAAGAAPAGYEFGNLQLQIEAPAATADAPLRLEFHVDSSALPAGVDATTLEVFRNGVPIPPCTGDGTKATPAPCVLSRTPLTGGDAAIVVLTDHASQWNFGVDRKAPTTTITDKPAATITGSTARVAFTADEQGATFECRLDGGAWSACTSPASLDGLSIGSHTFAVRATDRAHNVEATPQTVTWTIASATSGGSNTSTMPATGGSGAAPAGDSATTGSATSTSATSPSSKPASTTPSSTKPSAAPAPTPVKLGVTAAKAKLAAVLSKGLALTVTAPAGTPVRAELVLDAKTAKRLHLGKVIGTATRSGAGKVVVRLSARARKALKRVRSVRLTARVTAGAASAERAVSLKR